MPPDMPADVFLSYSHKDSRVAGQTERALKAAGIRCFRDILDIAVTAPIRAAVSTALESCLVVVVILSKQSRKSAWVPFELGTATALGKHVVTFLLDGSGAPTFMENCRGARDVAEVVAAVRECMLQGAQHEHAVRPHCFDPMELTNALLTARAVWHQGVMSQRLFSIHHNPLFEGVAARGEMRVLQLRPGGEAERMALRRHRGAEADVHNLRSGHELLCLQLGYLALVGRVELRAVDHLIEPIVTLIDPETELGLAFVTFGGFEMPLASRPCVRLSARLNPGSFGFYKSSFERLWDHPETAIVPLPRPGD